MSYRGIASHVPEGVADDLHHAPTRVTRVSKATVFDLLRRAEATEESDTAPTALMRFDPEAIPIEVCVDPPEPAPSFTSEPLAGPSATDQAMHPSVERSPAPRRRASGARLAALVAIATTVGGWIAVELWARWP